MHAPRTVGGLICAMVVCLPLALAAQWGGRFFGFGPGVAANLPYDGRFTFARIRYQGYGAWTYDYPDMERNLTGILAAITAMTPHEDASNVFALDDPELLKFPVAYLTEPGYWYPTESEVLGLRTYLAKGGFLIVDDFHYENEWRVFDQAIRAVLPGTRIDRLDLSHPIFHTFFEIASLDIPYPGDWGGQPLMGEFYGIHEDNDPSKRLSVVINYNMDIGDYMEHSNRRGWYAPVPTNEAYKLGINYVVYGITH